METEIAGKLLEEIRDRLRFLHEVGLKYLTLGPSGLRLFPASKRSAFNWRPRWDHDWLGTLYVLDEPSIGLHSGDTSPA